MEHIFYDDQNDNCSYYDYREHYNYYEHYDDNFVCTTNIKINDNIIYYAESNDIDHSYHHDQSNYCYNYDNDGDDVGYSNAGDCNGGFDFDRAGNYRRNS